MKFFYIFFFLLASMFYNQDIKSQNSTDETLHLKPCPNSPNCVSTQALKKTKKMEPLSYEGSMIHALQKLEDLLSLYTDVKQVEKNENFLHYEFTTKLGKFIDDVTFLIDDKTKVIHFRSASRKGYGDFGKNKRRMKKIQKMWYLREN